MFATERRSAILRLLNEKKSISVNEISESLGVSKPTIRTDFDYIAANNKNIERTHGGLMVLTIDRRITKYDERKQANIIQKKAIAKEAFNHIENKTTLLMDSSSTCYALAELLMTSSLQVTVITDGLNTASLLKDNPNLTVILLGGLLKPNSNTAQDEFENGVFNYFDIDIYFFSASSVSLNSGFTDYNLYEIKSKKVYIKKSRKAIALIDSSKFGDPSNSKFATLEDVDIMITDTNIDDTNFNEFKNRINIIKATV